MGNLDNILQKRIKSLGISRQVEAVGVVEKATAEIAKYIPREDFEVVSFNRGTLKVAVASSTVANELSYHKRNIEKVAKSIRTIKFSQHSLHQNHIRD